MPNESPIDVETTSRELAVAAIRKADFPLIPPEAKQPITAAQAKIEAVANLTMKAYERAATLQLTEEESKALQADFPDEAFKPGAAGKEHLLYIEHAYLRDRLTQVLGLGQWAIIPRNRWAEPFTTQKGKEGSRVYVEAMLVIRGAFVGEAVGSMEYYPNDATNYGDAVEGAKTAALRRCAKELCVGLQPWKKDWCEGWWQRRRSGARQAPQAVATPKAVTPPPQAPPKPFPTAATLSWMLKELHATPGEPARNLVTEYFVKAGCLLPDSETLEDLPLKFVPNTPALLRALGAAIAAFEAGDDALLAFPAHPEPEPPAVQKAQKAQNIQTEEPVSQQASKPGPDSNKDTDPNSPDAPWRSFPVPWGKDAGIPLAKLEKKTLFGWWANHVVETEYKGKPIDPAKIATSQKFREMLTEAGKHYGFVKAD